MKPSIAEMEAAHRKCGLRICDEAIDAITKELTHD